MRQLVVGAFTTLDGVMQAPGGPDEDRDDGFQHGGWLVPFFDDTFAQIMTEWTMRAGAFLLGRKTYEIFAGSWPNSTDPADESAVALNTRPKFVASRTLDTVSWNNSALLEGDIAEEVAKLKAMEGGEIQVHGSSNLIQTLLRHDLVDALRIWQFPVVLGTGRVCLATAPFRATSGWWRPSSTRQARFCTFTSGLEASNMARSRSARRP